MNDIDIDKTLRPTDEGDYVDAEYQFLADMLGGLSEIDSILRSLQNRILIDNMQLPVEREGDAQRNYNRARYTFYNRIRTEIQAKRKREKLLPKRK